MKGSQLFKKQLANFYIKYQEKSHVYANGHNPIAIQHQKIPQQLYFRRNCIKSKQRKLNHQSIDLSEIDKSRKRKGHVLSQDTEEVTGKKTQKVYQSISFRQNTLQKSISEKSNFQRVPIQYSDEKYQFSGSGRIVYKGYTPKNSYYWMTFSKQVSEDLSTETGKKNNYETELEFNSKFESGNLLQAMRISKKQYWLHMREDTNTNGLKQWYFFEVICNRPLRVTFRIYKFNKRYSLYKKGMKPYIKQNESQWTQKGEEVKYAYDEQQRCFFLQFNYQFKRERQRILVAAMPPYTLSKLNKFIGRLIGRNNLKLRNIGRSLGGVEIPLIQIVQKKEENKQFPESDNRKKAIIILGRTHPAETCSSFSIQAIVESILNNESLQKIFDFYIVPMTNPDGVIVGNHRTSLVGVDLNRKFDFSFAQKQLFPEVSSLKGLVRDINVSHKIQFLIDLHGHSARENMFAYGEQQLLQSQKHLKSRIIPKLLSQKMQSFAYDFCIFQSYKQKKSTARVYFSKEYNINSLTIEQSYGLIGDQLIGINDWILFGQTLVQVLQQYASKFMDKSKEMGERLQKEIQQQKSFLETKKEQRAKKEKSVQTLLGQQKHQQLEFNVQVKQVKKQIINDQEQSLSSGNEQLQNGEAQLEILRKKIFVNKNEVPQRHSYVLSDKSIELQEQEKNFKDEIIHEQKLPLVSRIMRMQSKRQTSKALIDILTHRSKNLEKEVKQKIKQLQIKLPTLNKYI